MSHVTFLGLSVLNRSTLRRGKLLSHQRTNIEVAQRDSAEPGTVIAPTEKATVAGLQMYERGGNALDAAVAAALVSGVIEPTETTLAGSGFMLIQTPEGEAYEVNFGPKAPYAATEDMFQLAAAGAGSQVLGIAPVEGNANVDGPLANGVPRTLIGLLKGHEKFGALRAESVLAPAISAAADGFNADPWYLVSALSDIDRLRANETAREIFLTEDGLPKGARTAIGYGPSFGNYGVVKQSTLAQTLQTIADEGIETLISGSLASDVVATSQELGGLLTLRDMREAIPEIGRPLTAKYRDHEVMVSSAPGGGITVLEILNIWEQLHSDPTAVANDPKLAAQMALVLRNAFADRYHWLGDPAYVGVPLAGLLSADYGKHIASKIMDNQQVEHWDAGPPWQTFANYPVNNPWQFDVSGEDAPVWAPRTATAPTSGTTHISAADQEGRVVSITHTAANHFGNGIVCPRTGLLFDSSMAWFNAAPGAANSVSPGGRALANMAPALLRNANGTVALGASGGRRIVGAIAQLIVHMVDGDMSIAEALAAPRIDGSGPDVLVPETIDTLHEAWTGISTRTLHPSNAPFPMDFSRPSMAASVRGRAASAILQTHYSSSN